MTHGLWRALLIVCLAGSALRAQDAPWMEGTYYAENLLGNEVPIADLLLDFSRSQGVPVLISEDVQGSVIVQYPELTPVEYLDRLTLDTGLIWYYDGAAIHIYTSGELQSVVLPLGEADAAALVEALRRLGVYSEKFPIIAEPEYGLLYVVGPARYIEIIQKISAGAERRALEQARVRIDVEVIPLRYAWADDQTFVVGNSQVVVPGVATILRAVLSDNPQAVTGRQVAQIPYNLPSLRGLGLIRPENQAIAHARDAAMNAELAARQAEAQAQATTSAQQSLSTQLAVRQGAGDEGAPLPEGESAAQYQAEQRMAAQVQAIIQADPRTNSIIIRDVQERMDGYRRIIRELDRAGGLVEIKATIVDLDANEAFQLGLPYHLMWDDNGDQQTFRAKLDTTNLAELALNPGNVTVSLMDDQVTRFFLNLQALETDGHARVVSNPSVVTINNIEAYLDEIEEFYVRVPGFEQVDLFNISVGTKLYVVPHIIHEPDGRRIKLNVRIEDGSRSETAEVDEIPVVRRNTVNTQAVLLEGQSLLIGGLVREEETKTVRGIPLLGRLPKVGAFFRETVHEKLRIERVVLLTPTIIDLPEFDIPDDLDEQRFNPPPVLPRAQPYLPTPMPVPDPNLPETMLPEPTFLEPTLREPAAAVRRGLGSTGSIIHQTQLTVPGIRSRPAAGEAAGRARVD